MTMKIVACSPCEGRLPMLFGWALLLTGCTQAFSPPNAATTKQQRSTSTSVLHETSLPSARDFFRNVYTQKPSINNGIQNENNDDDEQVQGTFSLGSFNKNTKKRKKQPKPPPPVPFYAPTPPSLQEQEQQEPPARQIKYSQREWRLRQALNAIEAALKESQELLLQESAAATASSVATTDPSSIPGPPAWKQWIGDMVQSLLHLQDEQGEEEEQEACADDELLAAPLSPSSTAGTISLSSSSSSSSSSPQSSLPSSASATLSLTSAKGIMWHDIARYWDDIGDLYTQMDYVLDTARAALEAAEAEPTWGRRHPANAPSSLQLAQYKAQRANAFLQRLDWIRQDLHALEQVLARWEKKRHLHASSSRGNDMKLNKEEIKIGSNPKQKHFLKDVQNMIQYPGVLEQQTNEEEQAPPLRRTLSVAMAAIDRAIHPHSSNGGSSSSNTLTLTHQEAREAFFRGTRHVVDSIGKQVVQSMKPPQPQQQTTVVTATAAMPAKKATPKMPAKKAKSKLEERKKAIIQEVNTKKPDHSLNEKKVATERAVEQSSSDATATPQMTTTTTTSMDSNAAPSSPHTSTSNSKKPVVAAQNDKPRSSSGSHQELSRVHQDMADTVAVLSSVVGESFKRAAAAATASDQKALLFQKKRQEQQQHQRGKNSDDGRKQPSYPQQLSMNSSKKNHRSEKPKEQPRPQQQQVANNDNGQPQHPTSNKINQNTPRDKPRHSPAFFVMAEEDEDDDDEVVVVEPPPKIPVSGTASSMNGRQTAPKPRPIRSPPIRSAGPNQRKHNGIKKPHKDSIQQKKAATRPPRQQRPVSAVGRHEDEAVSRQPSPQPNGGRSRSAFQMSVPSNEDEVRGSKAARTDETEMTPPRQPPVSAHGASMRQPQQRQPQKGSSRSAYQTSMAANEHDSRSPPPSAHGEASMRQPQQHQQQTPGGSSRSTFQTSMSANEHDSRSNNSDGTRLSQEQPVPGVKRHEEANTRRPPPQTLGDNSRSAFQMSVPSRPPQKVPPSAVKRHQEASIRRPPQPPMTQSSSSRAAIREDRGQPGVAAQPGIATRHPQAQPVPAVTPQRPKSAAQEQQRHALHQSNVPHTSVQQQRAMSQQQEAVSSSSSLQLLPDPYELVIAWANKQETPPTMNEVIFKLRNLKLETFAAAGRSRWGEPETVRASFEASLVRKAATKNTAPGRPTASTRQAARSMPATTTMLRTTAARQVPATPAAAARQEHKSISPSRISQRAQDDGMSSAYNGHTFQQRQSGAQQEQPRQQPNQLQRQVRTIPEYYHQQQQPQPHPQKNKRSAETRRSARQEGRSPPLSPAAASQLHTHEHSTLHHGERSHTARVVGGAHPVNPENQDVANPTPATNHGRGDFEQSYNLHQQDQSGSGQMAFSTTHGRSNFEQQALGSDRIHEHQRQQEQHGRGADDGTFMLSVADRELQREIKLQLQREQQEQEKQGLHKAERLVVVNQPDNGQLQQEEERKLSHRQMQHRVVAPSTNFVSAETEKKAESTTRGHF